MLNYNTGVAQLLQTSYDHFKSRERLVDKIISLKSARTLILI
jgi:hypothetical protein